MTKPDPDLKLVAIFESDNLVLLDLAQAALEDAGIDFTLDAPSSPEFGFTPILNPVRTILVAEQSIAAARVALENLPTGPAAEDPEMVE